MALFSGSVKSLVARRVGSSLLVLGASSVGAGCSEGSADPVVSAGAGGASGGAGGAVGVGGTSGGSSGGNAGANAGGSGGGSGITPLRTFDFAEAADIAGWLFVYAEPATLIAPPPPAADAGVDAGPPPAAPEGVATAVHDPAVGNPDNGSILLELPFDGPNQKISFEVNVATGDTGLDLTGRSISARVRIDSGLAVDPMNPAGLKLYVKTGATSFYADSGFLNIVPGDWQTFTWLNVSTPVFPAPPGDHAPNDVRQVGIEFATGAAGTYAPATIHLDTVVF